ncbi:unnamed protein product [Rangifer tarandus platyrhynchus]|uniref:Uncharacterized protein n=1 Tax=Rangifer tarandus platyrhynchus TaxID=3082113 RepID=A0AC59YQP1_RANTA
MRESHESNNTGYQAVSHVSVESSELDLQNRLLEWNRLLALVFTLGKKAQRTFQLQLQFCSEASLSPRVENKWKIFLIFFQAQKCFSKTVLVIVSPGAGCILRGPKSLMEIPYI